MTTLAIATYEEIPELTDEDRLLVAALEPLGVACVPWVWTHARPAGIDAVLVRSCWDYHHAQAAFIDWIAALESACIPLANAPATIRWNMHKGYLRGLAGAGVAIPETRLVRPNDDPAVAIADMTEGPLVVKPAVSMSGWETHRFDADRRSDAIAQVRSLQSHGDMLVQAYRPEIEAGEVSILMFGGTVSHAIRKRPAAGEFRVQSEYGGTREPIEAEPAWIAAAQHIVSCAPVTPLIARVDGVIAGVTGDAQGRFVLMELEAIDPMLFLEWAPAGKTTMLAGAIRSWLDRALGSEPTT